MEKVESVVSRPHKIEVTERFSTAARIFLQQKSSFQIVDKSESADVDGVIIRSQTKINERFLSERPRLKVIVTATSGFDHIDLDLCRRQNLTVMFCPHAHVQSTAELALFMTLACLRKYPSLEKSVRAGDWQIDHLFGNELSEKTVGIIGLGRIGRRFRKLLEPFGCTVLAYDPYIEEEDFQNHSARRVGFEEIVKESDIVSLHVPKTPETTPLFSASVFDYTSPDLILINCSRGSVIREEDLVRALAEKKLRAAGLDVFEREPLSRDSQLLKFRNVIFTPHMGAKTEEALERASFEAAGKISNFFDGGVSTDTLPPRAPWYGLELFPKKE